MTHDFKLFTTVVGSHMWKMSTPDSDMDLFTCRAEPVKNILRGTGNFKSRFIRGNVMNNTDEAIHEASVVVEQLLKGNINFLVGTMSPVVKRTTEWHKSLCEVIENNLAANCYNSIRGLGEQNYRKYIKTNRDNTPSRRGKIMRVIGFGHHILTGEGIWFDPVYNVTEEELHAGLYELEKAWRDTKLSKDPPEKPYRDWLQELRTYMAEGNV